MENAILGDHFGAARLLLQHTDADVNDSEFYIRNDYKVSRGHALHYAAIKGRFVLLKFLIGLNGVDVNLANDMSGETALHMSARRGHLEIVNYLLSLPNLDRNATCAMHRTALHVALWHDQLEVAECLLAARVDPSRVDYRGETPLHIAVQTCDLRIIRLVKAAYPAACSIQNILGVTPFQYLTIRKI